MPSFPSSIGLFLALLVSETFMLHIYKVSFDAFNVPNVSSYLTLIKRLPPLKFCW